MGGVCDSENTNPNKNKVRRKLTSFCWSPYLALDRTLRTKGFPNLTRQESNGTKIYLYGTGTAGAGLLWTRLELGKAISHKYAHTLSPSLPAELEAAGPDLHCMWQVLSTPTSTGQMLSVLPPPMLAFLPLLGL
jgi:hypothetical protein